MVVKLKLKQRLFELLVFCLRLLLAAIWAYGIEVYWFRTGHMLNYLWLINLFKVKEVEVAVTRQRIEENYPPRLSLITNVGIAFVLWLIGKNGGLLRTRNLWDLTKKAFQLSILFYFLQMQVCFITGLHWQPYMHNQLQNLYILFAMNVCLSVKPGPRICRLFVKQHS